MITRARTIQLTKREAGLLVEEGLLVALLVTVVIVSIGMFQFTLNNKYCEILSMDQLELINDKQVGASSGIGCEPPTVGI